MIGRLILRTAVCAALCATGAAAQDARHAPPRVYVYTAEPKSAAATEEEQGREDSARDVRDALRRNSKIVVVNEASAAQVLVEIVGREKRESAAGGFGGTSVTEFGETIVRLHVTFGSRDADIKGTAQAYWGRAAKDAAERLIKWITRASVQQ